MIQEVKADWKGNMTFDAEVSGHHIILDALPASGGEDQGARPKELMLASLSGCTGMDVISILKKMRIEVREFNVIVQGELTEDHPKHYTKMHIIYEFAGDSLPLENLEKAINLSQDRYCGVSHVYRKSIQITHEIKIL